MKPRIGMEVFVFGLMVVALMVGVMVGARSAKRQIIANRHCLDVLHARIITGELDRSQGVQRTIDIDLAGYTYYGLNECQHDQGRIMRPRPVTLERRVGAVAELIFDIHCDQCEMLLVKGELK